MRDIGGTFPRFLIITALAATAFASAFGQDTAPEPTPVARALPVDSGGGTAPANPIQVATPTPIPSAPVPLRPSPAPANPPAATGSPTPAIQWLKPAVPGAQPTTTGKPPAFIGTEPVISGSAPAISGTAPIVSGTLPAASGTASVAVVPPPAPRSPYSIEIDLEHQRAYLLKDGKKIAESPISSGRAGHLTPTGNFSVIEKDLNHFSNLYGKIVEKGSGSVVKSGADVATPVPKGCKFVPAPMKWFVRFEGAAGMHAGILPGYPASHGCVRMPASKAELFFKTVTLGTPVHVFGDPPLHEVAERKEPVHHHAIPVAVAVAQPVPQPVATPGPKHGWWHF